MDFLKYGTSPIPASITSVSCLLSSISGLQNKPGFPNYHASILASALFGGSAYIISQDTENGSSTFTAWGVLYSSLYAYPAFKSRKVGPIALNCLVIGTTVLYGMETIDSFL